MKVITMLERAAEAARTLLEISENKINQILTDLASEIVTQSDLIISHNQQDLCRMDSCDPRYDRLLLDKARIGSIAADIINVSSLAKPCGEVMEQKTLDNGLEFTKIRVPLGVIGVIYEARPNVTLDVFALCLKSQNACVLKGGSDAESSNRILCEIIKSVLEKNEVSPEIVQLLPADREAALQLMKANKLVDVLIPRGSSGLINFVRENSTVPVIETGAGIVHAYVDKSADVKKCTDVVTNAKTRRVSVCNALDCLVIHRDQLKNLCQICASLGKEEVVIFADEAAYASLKGSYPEALLQVATEESFGTEFLSYKMSIKTVDSISDAVKHITNYSSKHSELILTEDVEAAEHFINQIDAAAVYVNTSTAFTDGAQFGLGAEIGISTQKLHARGPMGLKEITSYKWVIKGDGHIRA